MPREWTIAVRVLHVDSLCCEPILRRTPFGMILLCECGGGKEPAPDNKVLTFLSEDGEVWSEPLETWPEENGAQCLTEAIVWQDMLYGFFLRHDGDFLNMRTVIRRTADGRNWENIPAPASWAENIIVRGAAMTPSGSWVIPWQRYDVPAGIPEQARASGKGLHEMLLPRVFNGCTVLKKDGSFTHSKQPAETAFPTPAGKIFLWTEAALAVNSDSHFVQLVRMDGTGCLYRSDSLDGGITWSAARPTEIPNPGNKPRLFRLADGRQALIHTPSTTQRNPLEMWISSDALETFPEKVRLSADGRLYHYADCMQEDGKLLITIERDRREILLLKITPPE